jgi:sulfopyruvate decarboxylase TPP-binding subunit
LVKSHKLLAEIKKHGITHVVGVPDNGTQALFGRLWNDPGIEVIVTSREGEAFALASGLYLGGKHPLVVIQNTGFLEAGDAFRGTAYNMGIPLVMLIGYRGYRSLEPDAERVDTAATFFEPTLAAWNIPCFQLRSDDDLDRVSAAFERAAGTSSPAAVILVEESS